MNQPNKNTFFGFYKGMYNPVYTAEIFTSCLWFYCDLSRGMLPLKIFNF